MAKKKRRLVKGSQSARESKDNEASDAEMSKNESENDENMDSSNAPAQNRFSRGPRFLQEDLEIEEEEEGEDLYASAEKDYRQIDDLDNYETDMLAPDDIDVEELSVEGRRKVDNMLDERDRAGHNQLPPSFDDDLESLWSSIADDEEFDADVSPDDRRLQRRKKAVGNQRIALQDFGVPLDEWLSRDNIQAEIREIFFEFLLEYSLSEEEYDDGLYVTRINKMCSKGTQSLPVDYPHIAQAEPVLALWLGECAERMTRILSEAAGKAVLSMFPQYNLIHPEIFVRIRRWPIKETVRDLRAFHLGSLLKVGGVVTRRTAPLFKLRSIVYRCSNNCQEFGPFDFDKRPKLLPFCELCENGRTILVTEKSLFYRHQRLLLQEPPGDVPPGRVPRYREVTVEADMVDRCRPGEEIEVTGVLNLKSNKPVIKSENRKFQFPVFSTYITANNINLRKDTNLSLDVTEEMQQQFMKFAKSPFAYETLVKSIAPSVFGCTFAKTAIALSLFGGQRKQVGSHVMRGDIHVLLVGDPGVAKSQCLKYAEKCVRRGIYTTGKGASAVGLTAAVHKDPVTKEWVLEGGALVLADQGVCIIDEFDKMNDRDRTAIHEAMEQQTISISKAGIVTTLKARCAVLAAANPVRGTYDLQRSFVENVVLSDPIIQRFDILCVLKDVVNKERDKKLAQFVLASHVAAHPANAAKRTSNPGDTTEMEEETEDVNIYAKLLENLQDSSEIQKHLKEEFHDILDENGLFTQEMMRKYIEFAKGFHPRFQIKDSARVSKLYVELRRQSMKHGGIPIAVRHLESIIRMSEAHARMLLKKRVETEDINFAIGIILHSFISAQKASIQGHLRKVFEKYLSNSKEEEQVMLYLLKEMMLEPAYEVKQKIPLKSIEARAMRVNVRSLHNFLGCESFKKLYKVDYKQKVVVRK